MPEILKIQEMVPGALVSSSSWSHTRVNRTGNGTPFRWQFWLSHVRKIWQLPVVNRITFLEIGWA